MDVKLTAEIHREGEWYVGSCQEVPEANGQGRTPEECVANLKSAIVLLMADQDHDAAAKLESESERRKKFINRLNESYTPAGDAALSALHRSLKKKRQP